MKILIDLDDTVWDLLSTWVFYLNSIYNLHVKVEDIKDWDMKKTFTMLTEEQITEPLTWRSLWMHIQPTKDAVMYIEKLNEEHEIYFVTATHYKNIEFKMELLNKFFSFIPEKNLIIAHNKDMILGDILIDDHIENLKNRERGILISSPFNKNIDISSYSNIIRFDTWSEIYNYIKEM